MTRAIAPMAVCGVLMLVGGAWLLQAHNHVAAQVAQLARVQDDDHDRLARIESGIQYVSRLTLMSINDQRAADGKAPIADEFPRGE